MTTPLLRHASVLSFGNLIRPTLIAIVALLATGSCRKTEPLPDAGEFVKRAEERLDELADRAEQANWVHANFVTQDTEQIAAGAFSTLLAWTGRAGRQVGLYEGLELEPDVARKLKLIKLALPLAAPDDDEKQEELAAVSFEMESMYATAEYCPQGRDCLNLGQLSKVLAENRDPDEQLEAWVGWRTISRPMKKKYQRFVELANEGSRELGFEDLGALWRSGYDMTPDEFALEMDRLWGQVRPLYKSLHCYVRGKLWEHYGEELVPLDRLIPAHLLGNMWSQQWGNIYDLAGSERGGEGLDLTSILREKKVDELEMVRYGESFFVSLGFAPLPETFWERSLFRKPADREVMCHASAWNLDGQDDIRIKMCIDVTGEDFATIHHELGHNIYQRAYNQQPFLFQDGAHGGFHEGIGDTIALSITPEYLKQVGLIDQVPESGDDVAQLLRLALDKVAFLPFGLLVDQWRWKVFSGETPADRYNQSWWELVEKYQGVRSPVARSEEDFDPGAKYHIPANTSYERYFLAHILQFQFHRGLCREAGYEGPLHKCSIYNSKKAGAKLKAMLEMGASRPWPDALEVISGQREMDASAILDYFAPLKQWLDEQNGSRACGW